MISSEGQTTFSRLFPFLFMLMPFSQILHCSFFILSSLLFIIRFSFIRHTHTHTVHTHTYIQQSSCRSNAARSQMHIQTHRLLSSSCGLCVCRVRATRARVCMHALLYWCAAVRSACTIICDSVYLSNC